MKAGTMPLTVQVPEMPPISRRMTMAVVMSPTFALIASSKAFQGVLKKNMESAMHTPAEKRRETWLAPRMASLPNTLISSASRATSTAMGIRDTRVPFAGDAFPAGGVGVVICPFVFYPAKIRKKAGARIRVRSSGCRDRGATR